MNEGASSAAHRTDAERIDWLELGALKRRRAAEDETKEKAM